MKKGKTKTLPLDQYKEYMHIHNAARNKLDSLFAIHKKRSLDAIVKQVKNQHYSMFAGKYPELIEGIAELWKQEKQKELLDKEQRETINAIEPIPDPDTGRNLEDIKGMITQKATTEKARKLMRLLLGGEFELHPNFKIEPFFQWWSDQFDEDLVKAKKNIWSEFKDDWKKKPLKK